MKVSFSFKHNIELTSAAASAGGAPTIRNTLGQDRQNLRRLVQRFVRFQALFDAFLGLT